MPAHADTILLIRPRTLSNMTWTNYELSQFTA